MIFAPARVYCGNADLGLNGDASFGLSVLSCETEPANCRVAFSRRDACPPRQDDLNVHTNSAKRVFRSRNASPVPRGVSRWAAASSAAADSGAPHCETSSKPARRIVRRGFNLRSLVLGNSDSAPPPRLAQGILAHEVGSGRSDRRLLRGKQIAPRQTSAGYQTAPGEGTRGGWMSEPLRLTIVYEDAGDCDGWVVARIPPGPGCNQPGATRRGGARKRDRRAPRAARGPVRFAARAARPQRQRLARADDRGLKSMTAGSRPVAEKR